MYSQPKMEIKFVFMGDLMRTTHSVSQAINKIHLANARTWRAYLNGMFFKPMQPNIIILSKHVQILATSNECM